MQTIKNVSQKSAEFLGICYECTRMLEKKYHDFFFKFIGYPLDSFYKSIETKDIKSLIVVTPLLQCSALSGVNVNQTSHNRLHSI